MVSLYFTNITLAQTVGPLILNYLSVKFGAATNPAVWGTLITFTTLLGHFGSVPAWYLAGKSYTKHMKENALAN